jgi:chemotaxis protein methyltransferase CheR
MTGMTDREFAQLKSVIAGRVGIANLLAKKANAELDIGPALLAELASHFDTTLSSLRSSPVTAKIWQRFLSRICNPESYFFREQRQFDAIASLAAMDRGKRWRIWCIPCSRGEEPYSLAMVLVQKNIRNFQIIGSDIREDLLHIAEKGEYSMGSHLNAFRDMRQEFWPYFQSNGQAGKYSISASIKGYVSFTLSNILDSSTLPPGRFDIILCRNLLIYFDEEQKRTALRVLWSKLQPEGYLCLGINDSIFAHLDLLDGVDDTKGSAIYWKRR